MELKDKIEIIKKDGVDKLQIISDFDATLTMAWNLDGSKSSNSISVFRNEGYLGDDYVKESTALFEKYHPIEVDETISIDEKNDAMVEWWSKHFDLLVKYGITKDVISDVVENRLIHVRRGFENFLDLIIRNQIPLLIFSSGVGDLIKFYLESIGRNNENIHIVSNIWKYDEKGKFIGLDNHLIHSQNKNMVDVSKTKYFGDVKNRKNIILMGDSLGDLKMSEGFDYDNIITIGFFNKKKSDSDYDIAREKYEDSFDLIVEGDMALEIVLNLIEDIMG